MSLLQANEIERYAKRRHLRRNDLEPIPSRWLYVLQLHLSGKSVVAIEELTGYSTPRIYAILKEPRVVELRQQYLNSLEADFETLQKEVFATVEDKMHSVDEDVQLKAIEIWMKYFGKYKTTGSPSGGGGTTNVTAENVVMNILQNGLPDETW